MTPMNTVREVKLDKFVISAYIVPRPLSSSWQPYKDIYIGESGKHLA